MAIGILGKKLGMTQIFTEDGKRTPVTVIEAGPCSVLQVRTADSDGYAGVQLGFDDTRAERATLPMLGHFRKASSAPKRFVREIRDYGGECEVGDEVTVAIFEGVEKVDVTGISKGKGFAGPMKRHGFHGSGASHGTKKTHRSGGSIGGMYSTSKGVPKGWKMAGHMGSVRKTSVALPLVRVDAERNLLLVKGSVPGANGTYVVVKKSKRDGTK